MLTETNKSESGITEIVAGIVEDFRTLVSQQLALLRAEMRSDWEKTKHAMWPLLAGGALIGIAAILFGLTVALGLHWGVSPADTDPGRVPLWGCFGIVTLVFGVVGGVLIAVGWQAFKSFNPLPDETANALEANVKGLFNAGKKVGEPR